MNYSTAILVVNDNVRCVKVTYENADNAPRTMFKTFDKSIKVDDFVVVPTDTRHNLTVCKVVEVDVDDWMETHSDIKWIVGKVNMADVLQIKQWEDQAITQIKQAEKLKRRREMAENMKAALAENAEGVKLLSGAPVAEESAPAVSENAA